MASRVAFTVAKYLPVLIFLACPLMMIFMMRGMGSGAGGSSMGHRLRRPDPKDVSSGMDGTSSATGVAGEDQARIARLEDEVAQLRAALDRDSGGSRTARR